MNTSGVGFPIERQVVSD
jgi:hypothetical protein